MALLAEFASTTSCHGIPDVINARSRSWRIFWFVLFVVHVGLTVYSIYKTIEGYIQAPTVTTIRTVPRIPMELPDVAVCYKGGLNLTAMQQDGLDPVVINHLMELFNEIKTSPPELDILQKYKIDWKATVFKYAFKCDEILQNLNMDTNICDSAKLIAHPEGVCYVINGMTQQYPGYSGGWYLLLKAPQLHGFHMNRTQCGNNFAVEVGKSLRHTNEASMRYYHTRAEYHKRIENCDPDTTLHSSSTCFYRCYGQTVHDYCVGCVPYPHSDAQIQQLPVCPMGVAETTCMTNATIRDRVFECQTKCLPLCNEWVYTTSVSQSTLDDETLEALGAPFGAALVRIAFPLMQYSEIVEQEAFTIFMAISNIGGQAGLWLGCSTLTIFHAIMFCCLGISQSDTKENVTPLKIKERF